MVMRNWLCVGDSPATGGSVLSYEAEWPTTVTDAHIPVALIGGAVFCNACKSTGTIIKSGGPRRLQFMTEIALDGDLCLCKCSPPPPIKATIALNEWYDDDHFGGDGEPSEWYDEQIRAIDQKTGRVLDGVAYLIKTSTGKIYKGYTDEFGLCPRIDTDSAENLTVWFGISAFEQEGLL